MGNDGALTACAFAIALYCRQNPDDLAALSVLLVVLIASLVAVMS